MRKRVLVIADSDNLWTKRHLENLVLPAGYEVVVFPIWGDGGMYADFYREEGVTVYHDKHTLPLIRLIPRLRMWARIWANARALYKLGPFDIVHNQYLSQRDLGLGFLVARRFRARWVCGFWGSDLLRSADVALNRMRPFLRRCDIVTVHNANHVEIIRNRFGADVAAKTRTIFFGLNGYADIDAARTRCTREECRAHFGIKPGRFVVAVGYNACSAQQQLEVLKAMALMPYDRLSRITLVLQQTYNENDPEYVARVREFAGRMPCQTVALTRFMGPEESALLRLSADVFILAITTDAFSASMQEYLYAGACVIRGAWLNYPPLDEMGIRLAEFSDFAEIPALLTRAMDGALTGLDDRERAMLPARYAWDAVRGDWLALYED